MKIENLVKKFVLSKENSDIIVDLTKLSTEYFSNFLSGRDYSNVLEQVNNYLKEHSEFKEVNPKVFSIELMKYLYTHRKK